MRGLEVQFEACARWGGKLELIASIEERAGHTGWRGRPFGSRGPKGRRLRDRQRVPPREMT
jgi:hypothetical protein